MRAARLLFAVAAVALFAHPAAAQQVRTISPGMTNAEVRAVFGAPAIVREAGEWTYWFYANNCLPRCGSDDVVFFQGGHVVAAVLRAPNRRFAGPGAAAALRETATLPGAAQPETGTEPREPRQEPREP